MDVIIRGGVGWVARNGLYWQTDSSFKGIQRVVRRYGELSREYAAVIASSKWKEHIAYSTYIKHLLCCLENIAVRLHI